jgi:quercetin dioxygenase-like cupin family protein
MSAIVTIQTSITAKERRKNMNMKIFRNFSVPLALAAVLVTGLAAQAGSEGKGPAFISVKASDLKWIDAPSVGPGAKIAVIEGDLKAAEPITFRLKVPANLKIGVHTHPTFERVTVISGSLYFAIGEKFDSAKAQEYKPGDVFIVPTGMPMFGYTKKQETVLQIHGTGPWGMDFIKPGEDPKKK